MHGASCDPDTNQNRLLFFLMVLMGNGPWIFPPFLFPNAATETKKQKTTRGPNFVFGFFVMAFIGIPNQNSKVPLSFLEEWLSKVYCGTCG